MYICCNHHPWQHFIQTILNNLVYRSLSTSSFFCDNSLSVKFGEIGLIPKDALLNKKNRFSVRILFQGTHDFLAKKN